MDGIRTVAYVTSQAGAKVSPGCFTNGLLRRLAAASVLATFLAVVPAGGREPLRVSTGLPDNSDEYHRQRTQLLSADAAVRFDAAMKLNASEKRLNEQLIGLRERLLKEYRAAKRFPPAEPFHTVRDEIRKTPLYALLHEMPKGGVLHLHTSSTAPAQWIIDVGIREKHCCVCWPEDHGKAVKGQLGFFRPDQNPAGYQSVQDVIAKDADFPNKLLSLLTINAGDAALKRQEMWGKFDQIFQRVEHLLDYQPVFVKYYTAALRTLLDDRITYVELRAGFDGLHDLDGNTWDYRQRAKLMWDIRNEMRKQNPQFDLKLIYSGYRGLPEAGVWKEIKQAVELRKLWARQNFILGFDLVGEEDAGHTTEFFLADWIRLEAHLANEGATLPLYFHDGESDWPSDDNLYDAVLLGSRRIGHGFNLFRFPTLEQTLKRNGVAVEVCPISNQQLRYVDDLRIHPASGYLLRGVPCVIGSDDPGIFGNDGLSYDYWETVMAWDLDLRSLKQLTLNSLLYSGMTEVEKSAAIAQWRESWDRWVERSIHANREEARR